MSERERAAGGGGTPGRVKSCRWSEGRVASSRTASRTHDESTQEQARLPSLPSYKTSLPSFLPSFLFKVVTESLSRWEQVSLGAVCTFIRGDVLICDGWALPTILLVGSFSGGRYAPSPRTFRGCQSCRVFSKKLNLIEKCCPSCPTSKKSLLLHS